MLTDKNVISITFEIVINLEMGWQSQDPDQLIFICSVPMQTESN